MATIKKSEVEHLRRIEKDYYSAFNFVTVDKLETAVKELETARDYWIAECLDWEQAAIEASVRNQDLKDKLWAAEQEIHDLKAKVRTDDREQAARIQQVELEKAYWNARIERDAFRAFITGQSEQIEIPPCLKPYDALHYAAHHVFYSPNTTSNIIDY